MYKDIWHPLHLVPIGVVYASSGHSPKGISVWKQYNSPRERNVFTSFGLALAFQRVFGATDGSHLLLPGGAGEGGNEGEDTANIIPGQLQQTPKLTF